MKNTIIYFGLLSLLLASCNSFLDYKDNDKVIPNRLEHYEELIFGELILPSSESKLVTLDLMTDEAESYVKDGVKGPYDLESRHRYFGWYTWAVEPQYSYIEEEVLDGAWAYFYHKILMCNIIEGQVSALDDDYEGLKLRLLGEVRFIRALAYYYLVNLYGAPYENAEQARTAMGVPINLEKGVYDKLYTRATLGDVYDLIEKDLLAAKQNLEQGQKKNTIFRPNLGVVSLFLARIYLIRKQYTEAVNAATEVITKSMASITPIAMMDPSTGVYLSNPANPGILFTWDKGGDRGPIENENSKAGKYKTSEKLINSFTMNDRRRTYYLNSYYNYSIKSNYNDYRRSCRIEEAYLIRAEANIESGGQGWKKGMEDINIIRMERITENPELVAASQDEAREYCREERFRELCFEDTRWFDIRRWNISVTHRYQDYNDPSIYREFRLEAGSPNYILPLPLDEARVNPYIERPKRVDCEIKN